MTSTYNLPDDALIGVDDSHHERVMAYDGRARVIRNERLMTWDLLCRCAPNVSWVEPVKNCEKFSGWYTFTRDPILYGEQTATRATWGFVRWLRTQRATDEHLDDAIHGEERESSKEQKIELHDRAEEYVYEREQSKYRDAWAADLEKKVGA